MENLAPPPARPPRTGLAAAAMVAGVASLFCFPVLGTALAVGLGWLALSRARKQPAVYGGQGLARTGIIIGCAGLVASLFVWAVFASMLLPALAKAKEKAADMIKCQNNLQLIGIASRVYALDHNDTLPRDFLTMRAELSSPVHLVCPHDPGRTAMTGTNWSAVTAAHITYEFLLPGARQEDSVGKPVFRCPIHGTTIDGEGSMLAPPRPPKR